MKLASGVILMIAGTIAAMISAADQATVLESGLRLPSHGWAIALSVALIAGGAVLRRAGAKTTDGVTMAAGLRDAKGAIEAAVGEAHRLTGEGGRRLSDTHWREALHDLVRGPMADFGNTGQALTDHLGLAATGEIMGYFATGERRVNRAYSAALDGYREESERSLAEAVEHLEAALAAIG